MNTPFFGDNHVDALSIQQKQALDIIVNHSKCTPIIPLYMIIRGTTGTGKSYLINCIRSALNGSTQQETNQLLTLAPTGVSAFNIHASTIHSAQCIPIKEMQPLQGQALTTFQEDLKTIRYILIDEMSFIGLKLLLKIDSRLRQAFSYKSNLCFGGVSIVLVRDLAQLPPVMDRPIYSARAGARLLWEKFTTVVTLEMLYRQQGDSDQQVQFRKALENIRNASPTQANWELLMTRGHMKIPPSERKEFESATHLFSTNDLVKYHNKKMLQQLNLPVALSLATKTRSMTNSTAEDEQLETEVLLCKGQRIMLTTNVWTQAGLVNGALGEVIDIVYSTEARPPDLPLYVVARMEKYVGPSWNAANPTFIPITPVSLGSRRQLPIRMAWAMTIHKSQGLTLQKATIDIGRTERQGLTFTALSRVKNLDSLCLQPAFSFQRLLRM